VKGLSEPVNVYEVVGLGPLRTRLQRAAGRGLTKFVGRVREIEVLKRALQSVEAGHGQLVAVMGEPGVGKSRLFYEFKAISHSGCMVLEAYSVSHGKASAYLPVVDLLQGYFKILSDDDPRTRREKITGRVLALDRALEDTLPYLFTLFGLGDDEDALAGMDANIRKRRTLEAIKRIVLRESLNQPLILIFEDLHWIDEQTQELLNLLADSIGTAKILLLVNYRTEYSHGWNNKTYYEQLRLDPLGRESAEEMLMTLLGEGVDLAPLKRLIIEKTEGTPFFMEEMVQALFEQQLLVRNGGVHLTRPLAELKIPPTVQAILASRIDRLPAGEKDLLQTLAVLGREFSASLVHAVVRQSDDPLERMLDDLRLKEFISEQPATGDTEYIFKHALTQEVAYNSVLLDRRKLLHERAAEALEKLFFERLEHHFGEIAQHYRHSNNIEKAVYYLHRAGEHAVSRSIYTEAITHFTTALELLKSLPDGRERIQQEVVLRTALGPALFTALGFGHAQVENCYKRARELCGQLGETPRLFPVIRGLWLLHVVRGQNRTASQLAQQLLDLAQCQPDSALSLEAHYAMGLTSLNLGQLLESQGHFEQSIALYNPHKHGSQDSLYGQSTQAASLLDLALVLWLRGYPDAGLKRVHEALTLARALSRPSSLAMAFDWMAYLHRFRREEKAARECAEAAIALSSEHGFLNWLTIGTFLRGWALSQQSQPMEGIAQMRHALATARETGMRAYGPAHLCLLAEAYAKAGNRAEAGIVLAEAFASVEQTGETNHLAELYRFKGELFLASDVAAPGPERETEALACFCQAIEVARRQDAKSLELRATISLARLLNTQGKRHEAYTMLADIHNWFTEGFDTADLKAAKKLLEELGGM